MSGTGTPGQNAPQRRADVDYGRLQASIHLAIEHGVTAQEILALVDITLPDTRRDPPAAARKSTESAPGSLGGHPVPS